VLHLYNSKTKKVERFEPRDPTSIGIYACGPTVYDIAHLGHARTSVLVDLLVQLLRLLYDKVVYVRNITDVDDKINNRALQEKISIDTLTKQVIMSQKEDMIYVGNHEPDIEPRVTTHMNIIVDLIDKLIKNGHAYVAGGHVFFSVASFPAYGQLARLSMNDLYNAVRIDINDHKKNPLDFVLWKPSAVTDDESARFPSPWSVGRPGWHIECSALSSHYLGTSFDIHCGGIDLKFPHHENEIAQSICAFGENTCAKYWLHMGSLLLNGQKMSKSIGNVQTLKQLRQDNISGYVVRLAVMGNHYRKPLNFNSQLLSIADKTLRHWHKNLADTDTKSEPPMEFVEELSQDFHIPRALDVLRKFCKNQEWIKLKSALIFLGIYDGNLIKNLPTIDVSRVKQLLQMRHIAKCEKNWKRADEIREMLKKMGIMVQDTPEGSTWEQMNI
jgi:cysteinyl-tRNA synthetase